MITSNTATAAAGTDATYGVDAAADRTAAPVSASVASWLGVLLVMLFALNTIGGWVRLSGAGVAIPQWPIINGSLLPPMSDQGWEEVRAHYVTDQERLASRSPISRYRIL